MTSNSSTASALIVRQSLPAMAQAFNESVAEMKQAFASIDAATTRLALAFGNGDHHRDAFCIRSNRRYDLPTVEQVAKEWKKQAWRILVDRMELKRICSIARSEEIDRQLEDDASLPEISEVNILAMLETNASNVSNFLDEAVKELFDKLRPWRRGDDGDGYATNKVYRIGERIVLEHYLSHGYGSNRFSVSWHASRSQTLRCLDNVMHLLDGKGTVPTHSGPLVDAINSADNKGHFDTEYFEGRCYRNHNLHLRFKRLDLLDKLNLAGSGAALCLPGNEKGTHRST